MSRRDLIDRVAQRCPIHRGGRSAEQAARGPLLYCAPPRQPLEVRSVVTSPQADGADRLPLPTGSTLRASTAASGLLILLLVGLLLRLTIAYVLLPSSGFESDIATYSSWAHAAVRAGPGQLLFGGLLRRLPARLPVRAVAGQPPRRASVNGGIDRGHVRPAQARPDRGRHRRGRRAVPARSRAGRRGARDSVRLSLLAAGLYLFNPVTWYDSAVWGQTDAVGALIILLGVAALIRGNSEGATAMAALALLVKPQFGVVLIPIVAIVLLRRHLLAPGSGPRNKVLLPGPVGVVARARAGLLAAGVVGRRRARPVGRAAHSVQPRHLRASSA